MTTTHKTAATALLATVALILSGCGTALSTGTQSTAIPASVHAVSGHVHGGQQPVAQATIQLYAVGITGPKSTATPLIASVVQTDGGGGFNITGDWDCTSHTDVYGTNPLLYIVASGGNPGLSAGTNNTALTLMAALGPCSGLSAATDISLNEVTTVASVVALTPFMTDALHIGALGANPVGLVNAFATANVLASMSGGSSPGSGLAATVAVPTNTVYALADMLAACVNSSGPTAQGCSTLFTAATTPAGLAPVDTVTSMLNINSFPANATAALLNVIQPSAPFPTSIATAPADWTVALTFTGAGLSAPTGLALDANGNAWVANAGGNSVTGLTSTGTPLTGPAGYSGNNTIFGAQAVAVDRIGNVWLADTLLSSVVELTVSGDGVQSSASYTAGGINGPAGIAVDSQNNVWVSNFADGSITELNSAGSPLGGSPLTAGNTLQAPLGIEVDPSGNVWVADNLASSVVEFAANQTLLSGAGDTDQGLLAPTGAAAGPAGQAVVADSGTNAVSIFSASGAAVASSPLTGDGLTQPAAVALDGQGVAWIANAQTAGSVSQVNVSTGTPVSPSGLGTLNQPQAVAVDASGSIWTANAGDNSVAVIVGVASPAITPLAMRAGP